MQAVNIQRAFPKSVSKRHKIAPDETGAAPAIRAIYPKIEPFSNAISRSKLWGKKGNR